MTCSFFVPGKPQGKARPRFTRSGHTYTPDSTRSYERHIRACWKEQSGAVFPLGQSLCICINAVFPIPASVSKKKHFAMLGKMHTKKPDLDNVVKAVLDALNGQAFPDDSAVALLQASKIYDERPGIEVSITEYET